MKTFIESHVKSIMLKKFLVSEELSREQKQITDLWANEDPEEYARNKSISDHVFGSKDRIEIPLKHPSEDAVPDASVMNHLEAHGYKITDYKTGYAQDKYNRQVKIGKALNATAAPKEVVHAFVTDPVRSSTAKGNDNLKVVISRHKYDVTGMSTDRGWKSCLTFGHSNEDYLPSEIKHGTHVAYLCHADDNDIKNPIARIALRPFKIKDYIKDNPHVDNYNEEHTILRPADKLYGMGGDAFSHTVRDWTEKNFPAMKGYVYEVEPETYAGDHFSSTAISNDKETLDSAMNNHKLNSAYDAPIFKAVAASRRKEYLDKLLTSKISGVREAVARYGDKDHLDKLLENEQSSEVLNAIASRPSHTSKVLDRIETDDKIPDRVKGQITQTVAENAHPKHSSRILNYIKNMNYPKEMLQATQAVVNNLNHDELVEVANHLKYHENPAYRHIGDMARTKAITKKFNDKYGEV